MKKTSTMVFSLFLSFLLIISIVHIVLAAAPPFTLPNASNYDSSTWIHTQNPDTSYGYTNQVVHPDIVYFPDGWGNVNGSTYKYWMVLEGYSGGDEDTEQPCILVSNDMTDDSWSEPAGNYYDTNPITGWYWDDGDNVGGHFNDGDIVYNDDTDELWCYYGNVSRPDTWIEIVKSSDGINWTSVSTDIGFGGLSPAILKEGNNWYLWIVNGTGTNHLDYYTSSDGLSWSLQKDCGYSFRTSSGRDLWHIDVTKYDNEYWGLLTECNSGASGTAANLCFIKSTDRENWTGYDSAILPLGSGGSWDDNIVYRSTFIVENGYLKCMYSAQDGSNWHAGYTYNAAVGGSGNSSNVITSTSPPDDINISFQSINWQANNATLQDQHRWFNWTRVENATKYGIRISNTPTMNDIFLQLDNITVSNGWCTNNFLNISNSASPYAYNYWENSTRCFFYLPYVYNITSYGYDYYQVRTYTT